MSEISITVAPPRCMAGIAAFANRAPALAALQIEFGAVPPTAPGFLQCGAITLSCLAPGRYLASGPRDTNLPARLAGALSGIAAITDQSDQWEISILSGAAIRETLARLVPIDLTPSLFRVGDLALTRAAHIDVQLWRLGEQTYELAVTRSYAANLRHILEEAVVLF